MIKVWIQSLNLLGSMQLSKRPTKKNKNIVTKIDTNFNVNQ